MDKLNETVCIYGHNLIDDQNTLNGNLGYDEKENTTINVINNLFDYIYQSDEKFIYEIKISIIEINRNKIIDLLQSYKSDLDIRISNKGNEFHMENLTERYVSNAQEILKLIQEGTIQRLDNEKTSEKNNKSDTIIKIQIQKLNLDNLYKTNGILYFINSTKEENDEHIKNILYNIIRNNSNISLIITCNPNHNNEMETLSTLLFGNKIYLSKTENKLNKECALINKEENSPYIENQNDKQIPKSEKIFNVKESYIKIKENNNENIQIYIDQCQKYKEDIDTLTQIIKNKEDELIQVRQQNIEKNKECECIKSELYNIKQHLYGKETELNSIKEMSLLLKEKVKLLESQINIPNTNISNSAISIPPQEMHIKKNGYTKPLKTLVKEDQSNVEDLKVFLQNNSQIYDKKIISEQISNCVHKSNNSNQITFNEMSNNDLKLYIYSLLQQNEKLKNENINLSNLYTNIKTNFEILQKENNILKSTINSFKLQTPTSPNLYSSFPQRKIIQGHSFNNSFHYKLISMKQMTEPLLSLISKSISLIEKKSHYYLSFNGGKDCLAAYIILKYYLYCEHTHKDYTKLQTYNDFINNHTSCTFENKVTFMYFIGEKYFECEQDYVISFAKKEKIKVIYCYSNYVKGLNFIIKKYNIDYIIMGTRKSDIKTEEEAEIISKTLLHKSTKPFPDFMRYYPVYLLSYLDIWKLILSADFPYLNLYDKGYSSIGNKDNTKVNINLYNQKENKYYPAWFLQNEESERKFR